MSTMLSSPMLCTITSTLRLPCKVRLDAFTEAVTEPYRRNIEVLVAIPDVSETTTQAILAKTCTNIAESPSVGHMTSRVWCMPG